MTEATEAKGRVLTRMLFLERLELAMSDAPSRIQSAAIVRAHEATLRDAICGLDWRDWALLAEHAERQPNIQENVVEAIRCIVQVRRELE